MNRKKYFFLIIFLTIFINIPKSKELSNNVIASIDNVIITELDLYKEINFIKFITNSHNNPNLKNIKNESLINLVDRKIKDMESNNFKIEISDKEIEIGLYDYLKNQKITIEDLNNFYKENEIENDYLKNIITTDIKWSKLIRNLYTNRINVNLTEVNKELQKENKNNTEDQKLKDDLIVSEKNILLNKFANSHLEKSKKKYLIKLL
jgi:hypothetical protein